MAGGKSEFLETKILDWVMGGSTLWTPPATVYVALSTALFDDTLTGATIVEPVGGAYARASCPNDAASWPAATRPMAGAPGQKSNGIDLVFPTPTAGWGNVLAAYVVDAAAGGNCLWGGDLLAPRTVLTGSAMAFAAGTLIWKED